jgi:hypothetical protein
MTQKSAGDKKKSACKVTSAPVQLNSSDTSGITSFSTSASIEARTIFITVNPEMSSGDACEDAVCSTDLGGSSD